MGKDHSNQICLHWKFLRNLLSAKCLQQKFKMYNLNRVFNMNFSKSIWTFLCSSGVEFWSCCFPPLFHEKVNRAKDCATATKPGLRAICETERVKTEEEWEWRRKTEAEIGRVFKKLTNTVLKGLQDKQREREDRKLQSDKDHVLVFDSPVTGEQHKMWCHRWSLCCACFFLLFRA